MTTTYERIAGLISHIRNARFGEMVKYSEQLIDSGDWQDFVTPAGTRFTFRRCEYDYFLAVEEVDPTTMRLAYVNAAPPDKLMRLADITGCGKPPKNGDRRPREEVVRECAADPSGAAARIQAWAKASVVTERTAIVAKDQARRKAVESGQPLPPKRPNSKVWRVRWSDDRSTARAIVDKLLADPELAHEVYQALDAIRVRTLREHNRRSNGQSGISGGRLSGAVRDG